MYKSAIAALLSSSVSSQYVKIAEEVKYSDGTEGIALSVSDYAIDYLKVLYLPHIYEKVHEFDLPEFDFKHGIITGTVTSTQVTIPEPEQYFIKNWKTNFISEDNSLRIANSHQSLNLNSSVTLKVGGVPFSRGHVYTTFKDVDFQFDLEFTTQDAKYIEGTGMMAGSEMAPAIDIANINMSVDEAQSDIKVDGFFLSGLADKVIETYKSDLIDKIIKSSESYVETTIVDKINGELEDLDTHFNLGDGLGFDYSLTRVPQVTDDAMLTFYMNGTFYDERAQAGDSEIVNTEHDLFEIGSVSEQDLMIHVPQSTFESGIKTLYRDGGFNISAMWETVFGEPLTAGTTTFKRICKKCSEVIDPSDPVNVQMYFHGDHDLNMTSNNIQFDLSALEFEIRDGQQNLLTDFELEEIDFDMSISTQPLIAMVSNNVSNFKFKNQKILKEGNLYIDIRSIMKDNSEALGDITQDIGSYFGDRHKQYNTLVFFSELEGVISSSGLVFAGLTFDDLYLGRPQNWNEDD